MTATGEIKNVCGVMDVCFELAVFYVNTMLAKFNGGR